MQTKISRNSPLKPVVPAGTSVKVIGLGGVGSIVARYAACFLASQGNPCRLVLIDGDKFEASNSSRMIFGDYGNKAAVVREELYPRFKESCLQLLDIEEYITQRNAKRLIREQDIILLCVDNHTTRKLVNNRCLRLKNVTLISGGNDGIGEDSTGRYRRGTYGNAQILVRRRNKNSTPDLAKFHPEIAKPKDKHPGDKSCTDLIASVPQILFSNLAVASAMLNTMLIHLSGQTHYAELSFDIAEGLMRPTVKAYDKPSK